MPPHCPEDMGDLNANSISDLEMYDALGWPARFRTRYGRAPRVLHICNIANYAYVNASIMRRHGIDCVVLDPDFYHVASTPEWLEARISGGHGDDFFPAWRSARISGFKRPEWFLNGPTPFVMRELAARESGTAYSRAVYHRLSQLYRSALGADHGQVSPFRRFMEGEGAIARLVKATLRRASLGARSESRPQLTGVFSPMSGRNGIPASALPARVSTDVLRAAMEPFDVIVGYALGARIPAALGLPRYVSLELGTIRGLPFEDSDLGRLCAWVYQASPEVFITNVDCIDAAERLGIEPARRAPIPHPFDLERALDYALAPPPSPLAGTIPYIFCPARHHWQDGNASWLKGNDVLIRGAAKAAQNGLAFRLVMVDWGQETALSQQLMADLGLCDRVTWTRPLSRLALWPLVCGAAAVADQFATPAFGGAGLESMALGKRVISRIQGVDVGPFFSCPPPFLHAATPEDVARAITRVLADPDDKQGIGKQGQEWMRREHGSDRQLAPQFTAFERLVTRFGPAA